MSIRAVIYNVAAVIVRGNKNILCKHQIVCRDIWIHEFRCLVCQKQHVFPSANFFFCKGFRRFLPVKFYFHTLSSQTVMLRYRKFCIIGKCGYLKSVRFVMVQDLRRCLSRCSCDFFCTFAIDHDIPLGYCKVSFWILDILRIWKISLILRNPGHVGILYARLCTVKSGIYLCLPEAVKEHCPFPVLLFIFAVCCLNPVIQCNNMNVILVHDHTPRYKSPVFPRYRWIISLAFFTFPSSVKVDCDKSKVPDSPSFEYDCNMPPCAAACCAALSA
nr:MAG TPA: hypothetical protein [Caudoviricetes sp.]